MFLGEQEVGLGCPQGVIHLIGVWGLEVHQALNVDAVGDEADEHGTQHAQVVQHPGLTKRNLCRTRQLEVI